MAHRNITPGMIGEVVELDHDEDFKDGSVRYGRWRGSKDGHYLLPNYLSGSDYSGSLVERSNYRKWSEDFADGNGVWWADTPGGHGTFGIIIDLDKIPTEINDEVIEFLDGLSFYPLADEELHSEMEMEAQTEAWSNWVSGDFKRDLEKKFDVDLDEVGDKALYELFNKKFEESNAEWINEQGDEMYVDLKRIVKVVGEDDVMNLEGAKKNE